MARILHFEAGQKPGVTGQHTQEPQAVGTGHAPLPLQAVRRCGETPLADGAGEGGLRSVDADAAGEGVVFRILPREIPLIEPIRIEVELEGLQARKVLVDFAGIGMNMGFNRPELKPVAGQGFAGTTRIPVCVRKRMDWEARVMVETPGGLWVAPFRFYTLK